MKKLLTFASAALLLVSCASVQMPAPRSYVSVIDYSALTGEGFFVTESNSVSFNYEPIGSIMVEEVGGWGKIQPKDVGKDDAYSSRSGKNVYLYPEMSDAFGTLKKQLAEMGANGIINLKVTTNYSQELNATTSIVLTGMAIRR